MSSAYAGIGSRETPADVLTLMTQIAGWLDRQGFTLRSGGADGADTAFERGSSRHEIFVPWTGFNGRHGITMAPEVAGEAEKIAAKFHPAWSRCSAGAKKLHSRNVAQVLGRTLDDPSAFVVCWTRDGGPTGGTGQALRIAAHYQIPIFNLHDSEAATRLHRHAYREGVFG